jgi:hypothetical protein
MNTDDQDLFPDGWREPGDDTQRLSIYIMMGFGLLVFAFLVVLGALQLIRPDIAQQMLGRTSTSRNWVQGLVELVAGGIGSTGIVIFFAHETRTWNLKKLSADRVIAGGFLTGMALFLIGARLGLQTHSYASDTAGLRAIALMGGVGLGGTVCLLSFFAGLAFAIAEKIQDRPHKFGQVMIERRYGLDDRLMEYEDHPSPYEDGLKPVVVCRTKDGRRMMFSTSPDAYDLATPGKIGSAVIHAKHLDQFHPLKP